MTMSFLITFKPAEENPDLGWPLKELQKLVRRYRSGKKVIANWRFHNRNDASVGDRVFLLLQGKLGPAIIGYGKIDGMPENNTGTWRTPIYFESLVDPTIEVLATPKELASIENAQQVWRSQSSGVRLPAPIAVALEAMVIGISPKPKVPESATNPDWVRDELIIALDFYLRYRPNPPSKDCQEIAELSSIMKRLGKKLFPQKTVPQPFAMRMVSI